MCTVTYLPWNGGFIITSNRDEAPDRSPLKLTEIRRNAELIAFPKDVKAGGTWIASSESGKVLCLLNGAFEKHHHRPPYRLSRGQMSLQFFDYPRIIDFLHTYDFRGIEPFTLVVWDGAELAEIRWDSRACLHFKKLDPQKPAIWSSSTLYPYEIRQMRITLFRKWLQTNVEFAPLNIRDFHSFGRVGDPTNDLVMNRNGVVRTVSITQVIFAQEKSIMHYDELIRNTQDEISMMVAASTNN